MLRKNLTEGENTFLFFKKTPKKNQKTILLKKKRLCRIEVLLLMIYLPFVSLALKIDWLYFQFIIIIIIIIIIILTSISTNYYSYFSLAFQNKFFYKCAFFFHKKYLFPRLYFLNFSFGKNFEKTVIVSMTFKNFEIAPTTIERIVVVSTTIS